MGGMVGLGWTVGGVLAIRHTIPSSIVPPEDEDIWEASPDPVPLLGVAQPCGHTSERQGTQDWNAEQKSSALT